MQKQDGGYEVADDLIGEAPEKSDKSGKNVLALDLGQSMGYAFRSSNGSLMSGTWNFAPRKFDSHGVQFRKFRHNLDKFHEIAPIDLIVYEAVRAHKGVDAAHVYGGFWGVLTGWCDEKLVDHTGLPVGTIKKHATGNGNATKELMCRCIGAMGFPHLLKFESLEGSARTNAISAVNNEADALAILFCFEAIGFKGA